ncbi:MAG: hypothetical protein ACM3UV_05525 [Nocardioidaceae bacterium]
MVGRFSEFMAIVLFWLYVHNACHNFFNRQWVNNDNGGFLPTMARSDHERVLLTCGCAFFAASSPATTGSASSSAVSCRLPRRRRCAPVVQVGEGVHRG